jgi:hypothetical protein
MKASTASIAQTNPLQEAMMKIATFLKWTFEL